MDDIIGAMGLVTDRVILHQIESILEVLRGSLIYIYKKIDFNTNAFILLDPWQQYFLRLGASQP